jgi:hypothetical protein
LPEGVLTATIEIIDLRDMDCLLICLAERHSLCHRRRY